MMKCKETSTILSTSETPREWRRRLAVRLHLAICPQCRAFRGQILALADVARQSCAAFEREPSADFETDLVQRLVAGNKPT